MLPNMVEILIYLSIGVMIHLCGELVSRWIKKLGVTVEVICAFVAVGFVFYMYDFPDGFMYIAFISSGWTAAFSLTYGEAKYRELKQELNQVSVEQIKVTRNISRIFLDVGFAFVVFAGAILFLLYGPEASPLKFIIAYGMLSAVTVMIKRIITYSHVKLYYFEDDQASIFIVSRLDSRKFPIADLQAVTMESAVDILKLHPFFTLFTSNTDFTTSFQRVLKLQFPGETVYLTIKQVEEWKALLEEQIPLENISDEQVTVFPFYHKKNIKRLLGKLYFAMTVKGISAYTGVLLLLYFLKAPVLVMFCFAILFWLFNLYISDRVLKIAMDAKVTNNPDVIKAAQRVFTKAGIPKVTVYETESAQYNGLATGMNIGRSMVTLTTATLKLPIEVIEGILAHEAVHVKKHDVLWGQLCNVAFLSSYLGVMLFIIDQVTDLESILILLFFIIWFVMIMFPVYQSFYSQWMEVRADHLGATYLEGGTEQMAKSLATLATKQDQDLKKTFEYSAVKNEKILKESSLDRSPWLMRLLEFQMMPHPPMYWRVNVLANYHFTWGKGIRRRWFIDRFKESFFIRRKLKAR
ncbi:M56 family metallopeptidase [Aquibacillus rhizosphaerae]|uniref:M56 family metallopeptidase n=1 Tax=Aquibacillus rhizosphaerae TaxID=3051431 RepID=A0ABT7LB62_9BACI|nr:M56 family metallopeptidase [Aquibacillus sp. LR5S19]MDL4843108.1 M56 family metallopeptidase [Aquibacillus sp. LR5S19]